MNKAACLLALAALACPAQAAMVCRIVTGGGLDFGGYEVFAATPRDSLMNLTVTCDRNGGAGDVTVSLRLGTGNHASSVTSRRMMRNAAPIDYLAYGLYRDVGRSNVWGITDGVDTMVRTLSVPNKASRSATFVIYGRVPAQQDVSAGSYADTIQATIVY